MAYWMALIMALTVPVTMLIIGFVMAKWPPKRINRICGYRTRRSMNSQQAWDFANVLAGKMMGVLGAVMLVVNTIPMLFVVKQSEGVLLALGTALCFLALAMLIVVPVYVERELAKRFDTKNEEKH